MKRGLAGISFLILFSVLLSLFPRPVPGLAQAPAQNDDEINRIVVQLMRTVNERQANGKFGYNQTEWYNHDTGESLGEPDGGVSVPALDALDGTPFYSLYIENLQSPIQGRSGSFLNPNTGRPFANFGELHVLVYPGETNWRYGPGDDPAEALKEITKVLRAMRTSYLALSGTNCCDYASCAYVTYYHNGGPSNVTVKIHSPRDPAAWVRDHAWDPGNGTWYGGGVVAYRNVWVTPAPGGMPPPDFNHFFPMGHIDPEKLQAGDPNPFVPGYSTRREAADAYRGQSHTFSLNQGDFVNFLTYDSWPWDNGGGLVMAISPSYNYPPESTYPEPDLAISPDDIVFGPLWENAGEYSLEVRAKVHNQGSAPAANVLVKFYLGDPDRGGKWLGDETIPLLNAGTGTEIVYYLQANDKLGVRTHVYAVLDPTNAISEQNEHNNRAGNSTVVDIKPVITNIDYDYALGWFMKDVRLLNKLYVTVDWNGSFEGAGTDVADEVVFELNDSFTYVPAGGDETVEHEYDMGADLRVGRNELRISARNTLDRTSEVQILDMRQTAQPPWIVIPGVIGAFEVERIRQEGPDQVVYRTSLKFPGAVLKGAVSAPKGRAGPQAGRFGPRIPSWELKLAEWSTGRGRLIGLAGLKAEAKSLPFEGFIGGGVQGTVQVDRQDKVRLTDLLAIIRGEAKFKSPTWYIPAVPSLGFQIVGGLGMEARLGAEEDTASEQIAFKPNFLLRLEPFMEGILSVGKKGLAYAEGAAGLKPRGEFQFFQSPFCRSLFLRTYVRVAVGVLWFEKGWQWTWRWVLLQNVQQAGLAPELALVQLEASTAGEWGPAPRDYVGPGYATFVGDHPPLTTGPTSIVPIVTQAYPYASPSAAYLGSGWAQTTWVHDDPDKEQHQALELYTSLWNGSSWSTPAPLTDDLIMDFQPDLAYDAGSGQSLLAWTRLKNVITGTLPTSPTQVFDLFEIAYAAYDVGGGTWNGPWMLTDNDRLDFLPAAAGSLSQTMVLWLQDGDNTFPLFPDEDIALDEDLYYAVWDGAGWSISPTLGLASLATDEQPQFAYDGRQAVLVWSEDTDGNPLSQSDREIFYSTWDLTTTAWSAAQQVDAGDEQFDHSPRLVYDSAGAAQLLWVKAIGVSTDTNDLAGRLYHAALDGSGWSEPELVLQAPGIDELVLVQGQDDLIAVWKGGSDALMDLYHVIYDASDGSWSPPALLTADRGLEWAYDAVYDDWNDDLLMVLLQRQVLTESLPVEFPTETLGLDSAAIDSLRQASETITITMPVFGSSDLVQLRHSPAPDLAVSGADILLTPTNPAPGGSALISATIYNLGDRAAAPIRVGFYDGNPGEGGLLIGSVQSLSGSLAAGLSATMSISWTVPPTPSVHALYAWVDPANEVTESREDNNLAGRSAVLPELVLGNAHAFYDDLQVITLSARITNSGSYSATTFHVEFRQGAVTGTLLGVKTLGLNGTMGPGEGREVAFAWYGPALLSPTEAIYVLVDPENWVAEAEEGNNVGLIWVRALPDLAIDPYDVVGADMLHLTVHNRGVVEARDVVVAIYQENLTGTLLLSTTVAAVPAAGWTVHEDRPAVPVGEYSFYVVVDPDRHIAELDESNNIALKTVWLEKVRIYLPLSLRVQGP